MKSSLEVTAIIRIVIASTEVIYKNKLSIDFVVIDLQIFLIAVLTTLFLKVP